MTSGPSQSTARRQRPTLKTIAEKTGLAITTVSKALRNGKNLNPATIARVHAAAREVGYRPDSAGVRLRTGKTFQIAVIIDQAEEISDFARRIIVGIFKVLRDTPYELAMTPLFPDSNELDLFRSIVTNRTADGIIFTHTRPQDERIKLLSEMKFPFVTHGRSELMTQHAYYDLDNAAFTRLATERLIQKGRRNLALVSPSTSLTFFGHALSGFKRTAAEHGVEANIFADAADIATGDVVRIAARTAAREGRLPDGVICSSEISSLAFIDGVMSEGLEIGKDVDVIARRTSTILNFTRPRIETVREDLESAGRTLAELMLKRLKGAPVEECQVLAKPEPSWLSL